MRYIDADWIYEKVENRYRMSSGIEHRCERDLLDLICEAPTADVVPRAELVREIFGEIEQHTKDVGFSSFAERFEFADFIAELKKKYTEKP